MFKPKIKIDRVCDSAYLKFTKKKVYLTKVLPNGLVVDYDSRGWLVGVEFLNLSDLTEMLNTMEVHNDY